MGDPRIFVIDVAARKVVHTIDAGARGANRLKFTPDGHRALVSEIGGGDLIVLDATNRSVVKRIKLGRGASGILIPPDGSRAFVAMTGENAVAVVDLKTLSETTRLKTGRGPDGMAWLAPKR
jgi:YVTN family beta-propeller protein